MRSLSSSSLFISSHSETGESLSLFMSKRKAPESRQPGIESFLSKSKRTEGNGGSDKATSEQRPVNLAFKKLLVNMCTPTDDSSDCEDDYEDDY